MIINRIIRNLFPSVSLCGKTFAQTQNIYISDINDISSLNEMKSDDIECLIYDDTPLLTDEILFELSQLCLTLNKSFQIGDGYISPRGFSGIPEQCAMIETVQFDVRQYDVFMSVINKRIIDRLCEQGVIFYDKNSVFLHEDVHICSGCVIYPFVNIQGKTYIGKNSIIYSNSFICSSTIGDDVTVKSSYIFDSVIGDGCTVGPFAYIRNHSNVSENCRVGDFVEIKNSVMESGVKCAHLTYIGDAIVGANTNVGCGSVFCNFDGKKKHHTTVGANVFIGANTNLVAPLTIGDNVFIAAGSTVTKNVPPDSFVIARSRQITIDH